MTMSPLYPCGKPCSRWTHNETVKNWPYFFNHQWNYDRITASNLNPVGVLPILQSKSLSHLHCNNSSSQISQSNWYCRNRKVFYLNRARFFRVFQSLLTEAYHRVKEQRETWHSYELLSMDAPNSFFLFFTSIDLKVLYRCYKKRHGQTYGTMRTVVEQSNCSLCSLYF